MSTGKLTRGAPAGRSNLATPSCAQVHQLSSRIAAANCKILTEEYLETFHIIDRKVGTAGSHLPHGRQQGKTLLRQRPLASARPVDGRAARPQRASDHYFVLAGNRQVFFDDARFAYRSRWARSEV